jgi:hypothetical protein
LAGDVGAGGDQEVDEIRHVLGAAGAGQGDALQIFLALRLRIVLRPFDDAGGDAVDGDIGGQGAGQAAGERAEGRLAGGIGEIFGPRLRDSKRRARRNGVWKWMAKKLWICSSVADWREEGW